MPDSSQRLEDALAFLKLFGDSKWQSCQLRTQDLEFYASRIARPRSSQPQAPGQDSILASPHLATLRMLAPIGRILRKGEAYGTIELLDETLDLVAEHAGTVVAHMATEGSLLEFAQPLVSLR